MFGSPLVACGIHISVFQSRMRPSASTAPEMSSSCGGPFGSQPMLVLARPLHAHRASDRARQDRGIGGGVLVAVHAVAAGAVEIDQPHLLARQAEEARERVAIAVRALRGGPHRRARRRCTSATAQDGPIEAWLCIGQK